MAQTIVELPHVGESVTDGIIGKWLNNPGDRVEKYEPLVEVVTDKVNMEVPSPYAGRITALLVKEGDSVPMGGAIATMETEEATALGRPTPATAPPAPARPPAPAIGRTGILLKDVRPVGPTGSGEEPPIPAELLSPSANAPAPQTAQAAPPAREPATEDGGPGRHSPMVRRLAAEQKVDLAQVQGTGMGGRVTKEDVLRYVEAWVAPPAQPAPDEEAAPLTPLRRIIAENMVRSATQIPQAWSYVEADVTPLVARREALKGEFLRRQ
ncbi:MAG: E3 binding domain-containing protein, partial [Chloroflexi bacterium]|nr:E3 binding domain-containing protein [Chloroflexota bacterium]